MRPVDTCKICRQARPTYGGQADATLRRHGLASPSDSRRQTGLRAASATVWVTVVLALAPMLRAEVYAIDWYTFDGGGGTSTGGTYVLAGTIGQPEASHSSAGKYGLVGGFWPGGPVCIVQFDDFARFAEQWLESGGGLAGDLDKDSDVDSQDLSQLADYWLECCPSGWTLR